MADLQACSFAAHRAHDWRHTPDSPAVCGVCHPPADPSAAQWLAPKPGAALAELEAVIERGLRTFIDVGQALSRIRDERLYRETHSTFDAYTQERWGWGRNYANKQIAAAETVIALGTSVPTPQTEAVARELVPLRAEPDAMREAWAETVQRNGGKATAKQTRATVNGHRAERAPAGGSEIRREHEAAERAERSMIEHATRAGELLLAVEARTPGREWREWLKRERIPEDAARTYMDRASREGPEPAARCECVTPLLDDDRCASCGRELRS